MSNWAACSFYGAVVSKIVFLFSFLGSQTKREEAIASFTSWDDTV